MQLTFKFDSPGENKYNSWSKWYKYIIDGASQKLRGRVLHSRRSESVTSRTTAIDSANCFRQDTILILRDGHNLGYILIIWW